MRTVVAQWSPSVVGVTRTSRWERSSALRTGALRPMGPVVRPLGIPGLHELAKLDSKRFRAGVILYLGRRVVPFGENLNAVPLSALWEW